MPVLDAHVFDMTRAIQLAVAPVFLLTAIGTLINALTGRLGRAVDRRRKLEELLPAYEGDTRKSMEQELVPIRTRAAELAANPKMIDDALLAGADRCRRLARETIDAVRDRMGF